VNQNKFFKSLAEAKPGSEDFCKNFVLMNDLFSGMIGLDNKIHL